MSITSISVVIPMYNARDSILGSISSVINQDCECIFEVLVVNDGSTDGSEQLVHDLISTSDLDIKLINKTNGGVSSARNTGIKSAKYDWIAFLDADDTWLPTKISRQLEIIEQHIGNIDFLGTARNDEILKIGFNKIKRLHKATVRELLTKMYPQTSTALVRKDALLKLGCYDDSFTHAEDGELWVRLCANYDFYYLPESLVITGDGKPNFGFSGLSSNLKEMSIGVVKILDLALKRNYINRFEWVLFKLFYKVKELRRLMIARRF